MPKIIFVNPPLTIEERYGVHFRSGGETPPLGLVCLATVLNQHGIDTRIVDGAISNNYQSVIAEITNESPDYVGITASTVSIYNAAKVAKMVKEVNHSIITIIGGPHITAVPLETMERFLNFDIGVIGEADCTITELLDTLESRGELSKVKGIIFRSNGQLIKTAESLPITDLDKLPKPAWDLLPIISKYYCPPVHTVKRLPAALMVTSRGCPAKCTFCDRSVFGNLLRANSAEYVMEMMQELYQEYGIREFQFRDDNFLAFRPRLIELCKLIKSEKLDIVWSLAGRIDMVNPKVLRLLSESGCWQIWYGIESGSQRILDFINKKTKLDKIKEVVKWTNEAGISACGFFMIGLPTETKKDIESTIHLSRSLELDDAHFTFFTPFPGCELYNDIRQYGEFDDDWRKTSCWNPVFVPRGMSSEELVGYWKKATIGFYMRPRIALNYLRRVKSLRHFKIYLSGLMALCEAMFWKKYGSRETNKS